MKIVGIPLFCFMLAVTLSAGTNLLQDSAFARGIKGPDAAWKPYGGGKDNVIRFDKDVLFLGQRGNSGQGGGENQPRCCQKNLLTPTSGIDNNNDRTNKDIAGHSCAWNTHHCA